MRKIAVLMILVYSAAPAWAERPLRHVLFDFEGGIEGWWGNVYSGGGACEPRVADEPKFGSGALHCEVQGVEGGSNTVSAWLATDAQWREHEWGMVSFWVRGDGSRYKAKLTIATGFEGDEQQTYSYPVPLDGTEWRKIEARIGSFWNRYKVPMDVARIGRIMFGCKGTHSFDIDHIVIEAPQRPVPLETIGELSGVDLNPSLAQFQDGRYAFRFDPTALLPELGTVEIVMDLPEGERTVSVNLEDRLARDELAVLWDDPKQDARGEVSLVARRGTGEEASSCRYGFDLVTAQDPPDPTALGLVPAPKQITLGEGSFRVSTDIEVSTVLGKNVDLSPAVHLLYDQLKAWLGEWRSPPWIGIAGHPEPRWATIIMGSHVPPFSEELTKAQEALLQGGYILQVTQEGMRLSARDTRGLVNGVCTLLQVIQSHYAQTFELAAPAMAVIDWPSLPIRSISIPLPTNRWGHPNDAPVPAGFFTDFLRRTVVRHKLNTAVLIVQQAMQYESHPKVSSPVAWPKETVKLIFDTLRRYGVEPVPSCNSLGHANWLAIPYRELSEDGDVHQFCTSNPETKRILLEIYQEIVDLVEPRYFHIGMDEIRWNTHALPEEQRCKLCAGKDKRDIFVEWVTMLHDFFTGQGIEVMMWGDMLVREHNGGVPYHLSDTIDRLPKDIIICNWSKSRSPLASHWFRRHGFERVIRANSRGVTSQEQRWVVGNMVGIWNKVSWLQEQPSGEPHNHSYASIVQGAEYSWNYWPDLFNATVPVSNEFFRARPEAQWRIGADPVPGAKAPEPLALSDVAPVSDGGGREIELGGLRFAGWRRALAPEAGRRLTLVINRPVAALYFLHGAELASREAMSEALKAADAWEGVRIGSYEIQYASGETVSVPIRYPMDVRSPGRCHVPLAYGALGVYPDTCEADGKHLYAVQWINPRPEQQVRSVTLRAIEGPARPLLAGLAIQGRVE